MCKREREISLYIENVFERERERERERESLLLRKNFDGNNHSKCSLRFFVLSCIMIIFMNLNVYMYVRGRDSRGKRQCERGYFAVNMFPMFIIGFLPVLVRINV